MRKKNKKRKFRPLKFVLILGILYVLGYGVYNLAMVPIKHLRVLGTTYLKDQAVLKEAKLDNYPSFFLTTAYSIKKNLKKDPYIKNVTVEKKWFCQLYLHIDENKVLFYNRTLGQVVLENDVLVSAGANADVPNLINFVPNAVYEDFITQMTKVNSDILNKISEIEYRPNEVDKERFLLTMNDGNYIYLTLYTFSKINNYNKILPTLENKKGILYLDSGNYFEIIN